MTNFKTILGSKLMEMGVVRVGVMLTPATFNKAFEETAVRQSFVVNTESKGFSLPPQDDMADRFCKSFVAAISTFLGRVKIAKEEEAVAVVLTDESGAFMFAGSVLYHANAENPDEPGNWTYTLTFNESDIEKIAAKRQLKKYLMSDDAFKNVFDKCAYDIGGIQLEHDRYIYESFLITVETIKSVLDTNASEKENFTIELPGYFVAEVSIEDGEKCFAMTPDGAMKELIKSDIDLDK